MSGWALSRSRHLLPLTDGDATSRSVLVPLAGEGGDHRADDDERDTAADSACEKESATTDSIDKEDRRECEHGVGDTVNTGGEQGRRVRVET